MEPLTTPPQPHPLSQMFFDRRGELRASWRFLLFLLLYIFFQIALSALLGSAVKSAVHRFGFAEQIAQLSALVLSGVAAVFLATVMLLAAVDHRDFSYVGLAHAPGWGSQLFAGVATGVAMMTIIIAAEALSGHLRLFVRRPSRDQLATLAFALVLFALGALHEELLFRGYAFQRMIDVLGAAPSTLVVAAMFGGVHLWNPHASWTGAVNTALVGILFALLYLRSGRLWLPIGLHWGWNLAEAAYGLPVSGITIGSMPVRGEYHGPTLFHGGPYGPEASILATGVITLAALLAFCWKPTVRARLSNELT